MSTGEKQSGTELNREDLSPLKRALIEIRRLRAELDQSTRRQAEPVAIVGMAVRLPGGITSPEAFWRALAEGKDLVGTIPPDRWEAGAYWSADSERAGTMYDIHGGFLSDIDAFDAEFFGIHPREAASMDPQHRILLELTWEALERAAIDPRSLMETQTGIYLGLTNSDYGRLLTEDAETIDGYTGVGAAASIAAGRIAYFLGSHGPAMAIDTACSSSLVAVDQAVRGLRQKSIGLAIVGSANLILSPATNIGFSRSRMLSPQGRSKTFDAAADGYVRSEGCCVVVLKRLADALRDGDRVLAAIHGTAVNQDGRSAGMTAPNGPAQEAVMRAALADAGLEADAVSYIEAHGTGTPLGDPMEVQAIGAVYGAKRHAEAPLRIGSVKTNLGHTEASAGLTGLIKVVLMMQPGGGIPPHLHFHEPSLQIDWKRWPIEVPVRWTRWVADGSNRYAGVSAFGFSGTNAHVIFGSVTVADTNNDLGEIAKPAEAKESLLCLSARHLFALRILAERYASYLRASNESFEDICYTAATGRAHFAQRLALRASGKEAAAQMLERWLAGEAVNGLKSNTVDEEDKQPAGNGGSPLKQMQQEFVAGGPLRTLTEVFTAAYSKVDLPLYPFQRKRFWFGDSPLVKRQKQRIAAWQAMLTEAERQSRQAPLGWSTAAYADRSSSLERLSRAHARNVLAASGVFATGESLTVEEVLNRSGFRTIYRNLVKRWLSDLAANGILFEENGRFRAVGGVDPVDLEALWREAEGSMADDPGALAYLKQCGLLLADVLAGRSSALETLFPNGSFALAEGIYESSLEAKYLNPIVASALRAGVDGLGRQRRVRILEIGGGTGGSTSAILPLLASARVDYHFTDVSELFLNRARRKFGQYSFVEFGIFDIDRSIEEQGFRPGSFDLVVAANVIHAARNLEAALDRVRELLTPGGVLVLLETTRHQAWFDMSTGLIEGWQHFEDAERKEHPLLASEQWQAVLQRVGFEETMALPSTDSPAADLGQHVILARLGEQAERESTLVAASKSASVRDIVKPAPNGHLPGLRLDKFSLASEKIPQTEAQPVARTVRETICRVFQLQTSPEELGDRDRLSDLGMDSLIALELKGELAKSLGLDRISSTIAFDTGTVGELVRALEGILSTKTEKPLPDADVSTHVEPGVVTVEQLETMSDEEVEQLLKMRLSQ